MKRKNKRILITATGVLITLLGFFTVYLGDRFLTNLTLSVIVLLIGMLLCTTLGLPLILLGILMEKEQ
jgi:hypothetical protein